MKILKSLAAVLLVMVLTSATVSKSKNQGVYLFGVSESFKDTIAYFTPIQYLDTVKLAKGGLLPFLPNYSSQLENYIEVMKEKSDQTAATFYSNDKKKLEKTRTKLLKRYKKKDKTSVELIPVEDFSYSTVSAN